MTRATIGIQQEMGVLTHELRDVNNWIERHEGHRGKERELAALKARRGQLMGKVRSQNAKFAAVGLKPSSAPVD